MHLTELILQRYIKNGIISVLLRQLTMELQIWFTLQQNCTLMELKPQKVSWGTIRYTFLSNHKVHKSSSGLSFWAPDPFLRDFSKIY